MDGCFTRAFSGSFVGDGCKGFGKRFLGKGYGNVNILRVGSGSLCINSFVGNRVAKCKVGVTADNGRLLDGYPKTVVCVNG